MGVPVCVRRRQESARRAWAGPDRREGRRHGRNDASTRRGRQGADPEGWITKRFLASTEAPVGLGTTTTTPPGITVPYFMTEKMTQPTPACLVSIYCIGDTCRSVGERVSL